MSDFIIICVPTPLKKDKSPDLSFIKNAMTKIKPYIKKGQTIILESTLPVGGMITAPSAVNNYLGAYLNEGKPVARNINEGLAGAKVDTSDNSIFRKVNLAELAGLQHYNEAIVHFNQQEYRQAIDLLSKALVLYPSERIEGLKDLSIELAYHTYGVDIRK